MFSVWRDVLFQITPDPLNGLSGRQCREELSAGRKNILLSLNDIVRTAECYFVPTELIPFIIYPETHVSGYNICFLRKRLQVKVFYLVWQRDKKSCGLNNHGVIEPMKQ